jgi:ABC-type dipeptide/oligopeptide/nickel transport system permease component
VLWTLPVLLVVVTTIFLSGGPLLGYLLIGSFVIELIFSVPGIGRHYIARSRRATPTSSSGSPCSSRSSSSSRT